MLVSGVAGTDASVLKYELGRPNAQATTLQAVRLGQVWSGKASQPASLGGDCGQWADHLGASASRQKQRSEPRGFSPAWCSPEWPQLGSGPAAVIRSSTMVKEP